MLVYLILDYLIKDLGNNRTAYLSEKMKSKVTFSGKIGGTFRNDVVTFSGKTVSKTGKYGDKIRKRGYLKKEESKNGDTFGKKLFCCIAFKNPFAIIKPQGIKKA